MRNTSICFLALGLHLVATTGTVGCSKVDSTAAEGQSGVSADISPEARAEGEQIFAARCSTCHGPMGHGDGPASAGLTPPPRNFSDPAWQASVNDEHIARIIQFGGAAVGKSPSMPANPDLLAKPAVVAALREHVRGLRAR